MDTKTFINKLKLMQSSARSFKKDKNCKAVYLTKSLGPLAFPLHCLPVWRRKKGLRWLELRRGEKKLTITLSERKLLNSRFSKVQLLVYVGHFNEDFRLIV